MKFLFFDIQTSGISPARHQVIEIGWSILDSDSLEVVKELETHLVRQDEVSEKDLENSPTGITSTMLTEEGKTLEEIFKKLDSDFEKYQLSLDCTWVGHYLQFEVMFLKQPQMNDFNRILSTLPKVCLQKRGKEVYPKLPSHTLRSLAGHVRVPFQDQRKRVESHIQASVEIFKNFLKKASSPLGSEQEQSPSKSQDQIKADQIKADQRRFEFSLPPEKRLALPDVPGVYRMLDSSGRVLYVGKATSLRSRVNSYFRGSKKHSRHRELLSQVYDLRVTELRDPLEAALLEVKEIHHHRPPYNVAMNSNNRPLLKFDRHGRLQSEFLEKPYLLLKHLDEHRAVFGILDAPDFDQLKDDLFFEPVGLKNLIAGARLFANNINARSKSGLLGFRSLVAFGLAKIRKEMDPRLAPAGLFGAGLNWKWKATELSILEDATGSTTERGIQDEDEAQEPETQPEIEWTAELVAERLERHAVRLAWATLRTKSLIALARAKVSIPIGPSQGWETIHAGSASALNCTQELQELMILNSEIKRWIQSNRPLRLEIDGAQICNLQLIQTPL
jgi:DNA polymerase III epsilon subunit-like protein